MHAEPGRVRRVLGEAIVLGLRRELRLVPMRIVERPKRKVAVPADCNWDAALARDDVDPLSVALVSEVLRSHGFHVRQPHDTNTLLARRGSGQIEVQVRGARNGRAHRSGRSAALTPTRVCMRAWSFFTPESAQRCISFPPLRGVSRMHSCATCRTRAAQRRPNGGATSAARTTSCWQSTRSRRPSLAYRALRMPSTVSSIFASASLKPAWRRAVGHAHPCDRTGCVRVALTDDVAADATSGALLPAAPLSRRGAVVLLSIRLRDEAGRRGCRRRGAR